MSIDVSETADTAPLVLPVWQRTDAPTWIVAALAYGGWIGLTLAYQGLPWSVLLPAAGYVMALCGSLQHETIHGHPTRRPIVNEALGWAPLWLWLPYPIYRDEHRAHHDDAILTDPLADPESKYAAPGDWPRFGALRRAMLGFNTTLLGRLTLGPALVITDFLGRELRVVISGVTGRRGLWALHALALVPVLGWLWVCAIPVWAYVLLFVYPGLSLTLLRSYAEHIASADPKARTVTVEAGPILSLLFLNNNLHALHHARPELPWYALPRLAHQAPRPALRYGGYGEVAWRFLLTPIHVPVHPLAQ
ncbi:MAG: fatty acid desaturase [Stellaceae bacterium]